MLEGVADGAAVVAGAVAVVATALALLRVKVWWVRIWDFPRLQVAFLGTSALALGLGVSAWETALEVAFAVALGAAVLYQTLLIWRYTRLAPVEVQLAEHDDGERRVSLVMSNVLQTNRDADRLLRMVLERDPDVVLCVETDEWWRQRLDVLERDRPHVLRCPLPNTYGMLLYSRLPLEDAQIDFLVQPDIPSMQAKLVLGNGTRIWLNCVHPRPPAPGEADESLERDAELLLVGKRVRGSKLPVIVCGDLNDVAWSRSTRLFQKVSRLLDPRKGRGFFSTFHARWPGLRWPLDHVFFSDDFRLVEMRRLPYSGSDHFPVYVALSHEPPAAAEQEAPAESAADVREAVETVAEAKGGGGG
jgi:endonuclease/exonuclease/phosphatase (EEP) superfamily protein YafD